MSSSIRNNKTVNNKEWGAFVFESKINKLFQREESKKIKPNPLPQQVPVLNPKNVWNREFIERMKKKYGSKASSSKVEKTTIEREKEEEELFVPYEEEKWLSQDEMKELDYLDWPPENETKQQSHLRKERETIFIKKMVEKYGDTWFGNDEFRNSNFAFSEGENFVDNQNRKQMIKDLREIEKSIDEINRINEENAISEMPYEEYFVLNRQNRTTYVEQKSINEKIMCILGGRCVM